jgi:uncharacterized protein (TIGR04376 family)
MGLFEDFSNFLETRLEEFLRQNPHLELQALLDQLQEERQDTIKLISELNLERKKLDDEIVSVAKEISIWHGRIDKAKAAGRLDLAQAAQEREASLLRLGNLVWNQRATVEKRLNDTKNILVSMEEKQKDVKAKIAQMKANQPYSQTNNWDNIGWNQRVNYSDYHRSFDPLEEQFQRLETDDELEKMKRNLNL